MLYFDRNVRIAYIIDWKIFYTYGVTTFARCIFCGWHLAKGVTFFIARTETDLQEQKPIYMSIIYIVINRTNNKLKNGGILQ